MFAAEYTEDDPDSMDAYCSEECEMPYDSGIS